MAVNVHLCWITNACMILQMKICVIRHPIPLQTIQNRHNMLRCPGKFWQTSDLTCRLWDQWQDCSQTSWGPETEPLHHLAWTTRCVSFSLFWYLLQALLQFFSSQAKTHHWQGNCVAGIQENHLISITARALSWYCNLWSAYGHHVD